MQANKTLRVGYDAQLNSKTGLYEYHYWDLGQSVTLRSEHRFLRGDAVTVEGVDEADNIVRIRPLFSDPERVPEALMFLSPKVPLSAGREYRWMTSNCEIVHVRPVELSGNQTFIILVSAPIKGRSSVTAIESVSKDRFHFFLNGQDR